MSAQIQRAVINIRSQMSDIIVDLVPSYASLLIIYNLDNCDPFGARSRLREALTDLEAEDSQDGLLITLPAYYSLESGPDLEVIAKRGHS